MSITVHLPGKGLRVPRINEVMKHNAEFVRYEDFKLWYVIRYSTLQPDEERTLYTDRDDATIWEDWQFEFPIPIGDARGGAFLPEMKVLNLMRWFRQYIEFLNGAIEEQRDSCKCPSGHGH